MKRFIYFLPGATGCPSVQKLRECGLAHAFPNAGASGETLAGPGNQAGMLVAMGDGAALNYDPAKQTWLKLNERAWVGLSNDPAEHPGPQDLQAREKPIDGYPVRLADGNHWTIPIVRFLNGETSLPRVITVDPQTGTVNFIVRREFTALLNMSLQLRNEAFECRATYDAPALLALGAAALSVNYRVAAGEVGLLGLLDTENMKEIANAIIDGPNLLKLVEEFKKKLKSEELQPGYAYTTG